MSTKMTPSQWKAQLTKWRVNVSYLDGWETRGRPASTAGGELAPNGDMIHHTGSDSQTSDYVNWLFTIGRPAEGIPAPLANAMVMMSGKFIMGAAGKANHAGPGSGRILQKVIDETTSLTVEEVPGEVGTVNGNPRFYGFEVAYDGGQPMTAAQYETTVRATCAIFDFHGWSGQSSIGHGEWTSAKWDPGLTDMAKFRRDVIALLKAGPGGTPAPTPEPVVTFTTDFLNCACMNAQGAATWKARAALISGDILNHNPHIFGVCEVKNSDGVLMRNFFDTVLDPEMYRTEDTGVEEGRYNYLRNGIIELDSGQFNLKAENVYQKDTKPSPWVAFQKWTGGKKGMNVVFHLEESNDAAADLIRPKQMLDILAQAVAKCISLGIPLENLMFIGDTNSENAVRIAMKEKGWKSVAVGDDQELADTYNGWGHASTRIDYGFVLASVQILAYTVYNQTSRSDHARLSVTRVLT